MNEAIKLAIEKGGYDIHASNIVPDRYLELEIVQDSKFWQALGKALGWKDKVVVGIKKGEPDRKGKVLHFEYNGEWLQEALHYHELLLTGGDTEKFWKELLTKATTA